MPANFFYSKIAQSTANNAKNQRLTTDLRASGTALEVMAGRAIPESSGRMPEARWSQYLPARCRKAR
jgi:hypothetical protein